MRRCARNALSDSLERRIDLGVSLVAAPNFIPAPGGAPANVAVGLVRRGILLGFMGHVRDDAFGQLLDD